MKDRHVLASVVSSVWGAGFFTVLGFMSVALAEPEPVPLNQIGYAIGNVLVFAPWVFAAAFLGFFIGTLTLGRPTAWLLRRLILDKPFPAVLSGGLLASFATCILLVCGGARTGGLAEFGSALVGPALSGGIAGLVYRRSLTPLPPPSVVPPS